MIKKVFFIFCLVLSLKAENLIEYDYELDIYYSNVSAFIDLDRDHNVTDATNWSEYKIYSTLVKKTFNPNIFLVEAAFHPMAYGGMWYRKHYPQKYEKASINDFNFIKALSAGWEEPYSISFFVGRMMIFRNEKSRHIGKNRAYMGYLLTLGNKTIKDNMAYKDHWFNTEFKLKGIRELEDKDLDWSFRIGYRGHSNKDIANTIFIGARRSSIDFKRSIWSLRYNSAFESLLEVSADRLKLTKASLILEKKFPLNYLTKVTFGLGIGYQYLGQDRYGGALKDEGIDKHQLIIRPNLKW